MNLAEFYEREILPALTVESVYADVDFKSAQGRYWRGRCPLHGGDDRTAFSVDTELLSWTCLSQCGSGAVHAWRSKGAFTSYAILGMTTESIDRHGFAPA